MVATAIVGSAVVGGVMSSQSQKKASKNASEAQQASTEASIAEQRRQFDAVKELLQPYVQAGTGAIGAQQALLGLGGPGAQQAAIDALQQGPQFQALTQQGENAILQNASATGGLRGGNAQAALAQFRPQVLSNLIDQQYSRLGQMAGLGQASAAGQAAAAQQTGSNIAGLLGQQGAAQAGAALAQGQANANMWNSIAGSVGTVAGLNALKVI